MGQQATFEMKEAANLGGLGVENAVSKSRRRLPLMTILMGLQQRFNCTACGKRGRPPGLQLVGGMRYR
jgi:hypothetical protein